MYRILTMDDHVEWDQIIKSFRHYDVMYLCGYAKAFYLHGDGEPHLFFFENDSCRAVNVFMKRDVAISEGFSGKIESGKYFDISTPYGYGGFIVEGLNPEQVEDAFVDYCMREGYVSEFARFHLLNDYIMFYQGKAEVVSQNIMRSLNQPLDEIYLDFEHKVRKNLRKAEENGLKVIIDSTGSRLNDFLSIYNDTMIRNQAKPGYYFSKDFFQRLNEMNDACIYFHVMYEDQVIASELILYGPDNCYSFLGGTNQDYFSLRPNELLKYEIIKWAKNKGLKNFILGGGYASDDGIFKYKKSFAPHGEIDFFIGKRVFDQEKYDELLEIRIAETAFDLNSNYFPLYRA